MLYIDNLVGCWLNICRLRRCHIGGRLGEGLDKVKKDNIFRSKKTKGVEENFQPIILLRSLGNTQRLC